MSRDEVARVPSPDGQIEAVLIETNGGATTSFGYEVRVLGKGEHRGEEVASLYGAIRSNSAYGVKLKWVSPIVNRQSCPPLRVLPNDALQPTAGV